MRAGLDRYGSVANETPGANFGPLQVLKNADGAVFLCGNAAQKFNILGVVVVRAVRKIQAGNVHAHAHKITHRRLRIAGWADGTNDFGATLHEGMSRIFHFAMRTCRSQAALALCQQFIPDSFEIISVLYMEMT